LVEYQNYEEESEDIVFALVHGNEKEKQLADLKVKEYQKRNSSEII
jgi:hypothetical protein